MTLPDMVACFTTDTEPWKKMTPGQKVKVRGKWPEAAGIPTLMDCVVVEVGPQEAIRVSVADLVKEHAADAAEKK